MNYGIVRRVLGIMLIFEAVFMIPSLLIAIYYKQEDMYPFLLALY